MLPEKVSVLIPTFNNEALLPDLLDDVKWADEIVVVDSFSTDQTVAICQARGARILQRRYTVSAEQKNWAIPQCTYEWIFAVDSDERVPLALQAEIQALLANGIPNDVDAFRVARRNFFLGHWMRTMSLYPDYQVRLFRKSVCRFEEKAVHAHMQVPGKVLTLQTPLDHYATPMLSKQINVLDRYSTYKAGELYAQGKRFRWHNVLIRPLAVLLYMFLWQGGFREGFRGFFVAFHTAAYVFFTHAKLWELEWRDGKRR
ncbi:MAG: glycosyltransferase family 2 protein [Candidatus Thermofonsia Clade 1 bacterium]|jgi:glycosyltransferase involved in cell wall biosynthesis|uniref:Glycosyltransferase family 2 protein n=1 Tax=Candidatus Thermofonsia Clade 1 bacterium TaxID=2364210 RepID=A0A2M8Q0S7_9CHLR|nr:MAG: glycosyltransferase family 2 protein [Candidatus Thermofonsia Clade 1 bacterium]PJF43369.1 MAG: glycosyltransferase family 2 protein [Candidatus Thermofonsia Clade 1 bacterium]RMF50475.1 MAG: glycosyltransferase family 2 protein [Chloroflexota bacterium]